MTFINRCIKSGPNKSITRNATSAQINISYIE